MSGIKTAISLDEHLFNEIKETARDLNTSRSGVIRQALLEFMERRRNQRLLDQLNEAYKDEPTEEEEDIARSMREVQQRMARAGAVVIRQGGNLLALMSASREVRSRAIGIRILLFRITSSMQAG